MTQVSIYQSQSKLHSVHPPCLHRGGRGASGPQLLEGCCWERGGDFFREGGQLLHNILISETFDDKKSL